MHLACIAQEFLSPSQPRLEQYAIAIALSFIAAVLLAPLILFFYRRRVVRLMVTPADPGDQPVQPPPTPTDTAHRSSKPFPGNDALTLAARQRSRRLAWSLRLVALLSALVTVALSLALRWQAASHGSMTLSDVNVEDAIVWWMVAIVWVLLILGIAWPMVVLGTANPRFVRWFLLVTLPCLLLMLAMPIGNTKLAGAQLVGYIALVAFVFVMCV